MSDPIDRQAAIDSLNDEFTIIGTTNAIIVRDYIRRVKNRLHDLPSAQSERKKGRWVHDGYDFPGGVDWIHCSECGKRGVNVPADLSNFCPNCGADMRGEK